MDPEDLEKKLDEFKNLKEELKTVLDELDVIGLRFHRLYNKIEKRKKKKAAKAEARANANAGQASTTGRVPPARREENDQPKRNSDESSTADE